MNAILRFLFPAAPSGAGASWLLLAARIVFGTEPSDEEILQFVTSKWAELAFFGGDPAETSKPAKPQAPSPRGVEGP